MIQYPLLLIYEYHT